MDERKGVDDRGDALEYLGWVRIEDLVDYLRARGLRVVDVVWLWDGVLTAVVAPVEQGGGKWQVCKCETTR